MANDKSTQAQSPALSLVVPDQIERSIVVVRGHKVLLDSQLASFYGVQTRVLIQAVKRNIARFPDDFMFQLRDEEWSALRAQNQGHNLDSALRSQIVTLKPGRGRHRKFLPYAFTEQGVAMLSGVLRSPRAIEVNILIMRAFIRLRQLLAVHRELADRLTSLEEQMRNRDETVNEQFQQIFALLDRLFNPPVPPRRKIGFRADHEAQEAES